MGSIKNSAVIQLLRTKEYIVESVFHLEGFTRNWMESSEYWPEQTALFDPDGVEDKPCKIIFIGTLSQCETYLADLNANLMQNSSMVLATDAQINELKAAMSEMKNSFINRIEQIADENKQLRNEMDKLREEIRQIKGTVGNSGPNVATPKVILVGKYEIPVSNQQVITAGMLGFNATGFYSLAETIMGADKFMNKNWKALDEETRSKVGDLLQHFILSSLTRENQEPPKPSLLHEKYKEIHEGFVALLNSKKYNYKKKRGLGEDPAARRSPSLTIKGESGEQDHSHKYDQLAQIKYDENNKYQIQNKFHEDPALFY